MALAEKNGHGKDRATCTCSYAQAVIVFGCLLNFLTDSTFLLIELNHDHAYAVSASIHVLPVLRTCTCIYTQDSNDIVLSSLLAESM